MHSIDPVVVQKLLDDIKSLKEAAVHEKAIAPKLKELLESIREIVDQDPQDQASSFTLNKDKWNELNEGQRRELSRQLSCIRAYLRAWVDGPTNPKHIMYDEYASTPATVALFSVIGIWAVILLMAICCGWNRACNPEMEVIGRPHSVLGKLAGVVMAVFGTDKVPEGPAREGVDGDSLGWPADSLGGAHWPPNDSSITETLVLSVSDSALGADRSTAADGGCNDAEGVVIWMVMLLGALGGTLHAISSLVRFVGDRELKRSWVLHYLSLPVVGAMLAAIVYMLLRVGILAPSTTSSDGGGVANLNFIAIYAFAALAGLFARTATQKLSEVFNTMFQTKEPASKDSLGAD